MSTCIMQLVIRPNSLPITRNMQILCKYFDKYYANIMKELFEYFASIMINMTQILIKFYVSLCAYFLSIVIIIS